MTTEPLTTSSATARLATFLTLLGCLGALPLRAQVDDETVEKITHEGREKSRVMAHLDHLVNRIGPRLTGSDNLTAACEWTRDTFADFGLEARLEEWGTFAVGFNRGPWWGRLTAPEKMEIVFHTMAWSAGTRRPSAGPLLKCPKTSDDLEAVRGKLANAWLLDPPSGAIRREIDTAIEKEGGFGYVSNGSTLLVTSGDHTTKWDRLPTIPHVRVRTDHYRKLKSLVEDGKEPRVEFDIRNHFRKGPITLYNVIADLKGSEFPDEYVVVGGHIDSWDGATGTTDNGTGVATTIEAARILTAIGARPRRTIRFMLWSGEEQGLLGSAAYVSKHKADMDRYSAVLVHDGGTNYLSGIGGMEAMLPDLEKIFAPVKRLDPDRRFTVNRIRAFTPIGSDHESFTAAGVPGFFWGQLGGKANYMHTHHTQYDTYDAAIPDDQIHSSMVIAIGALGLANLPTRLTREGMRVQRGFSFAPTGDDAPIGQPRILGVMLDEDATINDVVPGSLAEQVGLQSGDKLLKIGDTTVSAQGDVGKALRTGPAKTTVKFQRGNETKTVEVTFDK